MTKQWNLTKQYQCHLFFFYFQHPGCSSLRQCSR